MIHRLIQSFTSKQKYLFVSFLLMSFTLLGQQDAQFTQSLLNPNTVNPAFVSSRNSLAISLLHRTQWINIEGRPITQTLSISSPLKNEKLALGLNILNDKIGPSNEFYVNADFGYTIQMRDYKQFTFALKGGFHLLNVDFSRLNVQDQTDSDLLSEIDNKFIPQIGVGVLYQTEKAFIGLSTPDLLESKHVESNTISDFVAKERLSIYATGGYVMDLNDALKFQPSFQTKVLKGTPLQLDVAASFMWHEKFTLGASYRLSSAVSGLLAYKVHPNIQIGVAYDYELTDISQLSPGSYEFVLKYNNGNNSNKRLLNPRFF